MQRPLDGYRVLDLSDESGFLCGRMLAELGADVAIRRSSTGGSSHRA